MRATHVLVPSDWFAAGLDWIIMGSIQDDWQPYVIDSTGWLY